MLRLVLRRSLATAASPAEAAELVAAQQGRVIDGHEGTLLVNVADPDVAACLRRELQGWVVAEQGAKVPVPDTRLRPRGADTPPDTCSPGD